MLSYEDTCMQMERIASLKTTEEQVICNTRPENKSLNCSIILQSFKITYQQKKEKMNY